jgi:hypothetical protein
MTRDETRPYDTPMRQRYVALETDIFVYPCYLESRIFLKLNVLKPDHILPMPKSIEDQRLAINLPKCSQIDSLENFPIPKVC